MAEGAPLLREYGVKSPIEGSNPSLSANHENPRLARGFFWRQLLQLNSSHQFLSQTDRLFQRFANVRFG